MSAFAGRCAGCGVPGRIATIAADPDPADQRPVLHLVFGGPDKGPTLLCPRCRLQEVANPIPHPPAS
jgi:hypothetical protein